MMANISRLEQDIVDDHRLLIHRPIIGHGSSLSRCPLPIFSISLSLFSAVVDPCLARYGDGSCGRGAARSEGARPSVLIGFIIGMLN